MAQAGKVVSLLGHPPMVVAPYDAELFGHWWYEGPEFLDYFARKAYYDQKAIKLITPSGYLAAIPPTKSPRPPPPPGVKKATCGRR